MNTKRLLLVLFLVVVAIIGYQVATFVAHCAKVQSTLDSLLLRFPELGQEEFKLKLREECRALGVEVHPADIDVNVDKLGKSVRVRFSYTRQLRILFVSLDRRVNVRSYKKDLDI